MILVGILCLMIKLIMSMEQKLLYQVLGSKLLMGYILGVDHLTALQNTKRMVFGKIKRKLFHCFVVSLVIKAKDGIFQLFLKIYSLELIKIWIFIQLKVEMNLVNIR